MDELVTKKRRRGRPRMGVIRPHFVGLKLTDDENFILKRASKISDLSSSDILRKGGIPYAMSIVDEWEAANREKYELYDDTYWENECIDDWEGDEFDD